MSLSQRRELEAEGELLDVLVDEDVDDALPEADVLEELLRVDVPEGVEEPDGVDDGVARPRRRA
jgi:hypothetical protein